MLVEQFMWLTGSYEQPAPTNTTAIDDFNRADGNVRAGAGSAIWQANSIGSAGAPTLEIIGNQLAFKGSQPSMATVGSYSGDLDFVVDVVAPPTSGTFRLSVCLTNGTTPASRTCYQMTVSQGGTPSIGRADGTSNTSLNQFGFATQSITLAAGDQVAFTRRGSVFYGLHRPVSTGVWRTCQKSDPDVTYASGSFGLENISAAADIRFDNFVGGTSGLAATIVSQSRTRISRVAGYDSTDVVWTSNQPFTSYQFRVVPAASSPVVTGVLIEQDQSPAAGGDADTQYTATLTDAEVEALSPAEGAKIVKLFARGIDGTWST